MPRISKEKRAARRQQILDAATRCFTREGFHATSMKDIVRESKLSPGAIYCYFSGKHDIVAAISDERHRRDSALVQRFVGPANLAEGLRRVGPALLDLAQDPKERARRKVSIQFWAESLRDDEIGGIVQRGLGQRGRLTARLRRARRDGHLSRDVDVDALSRVMLALLQGFILQQAWEPQLDAKAYFETAGALLGSALTRSVRNPIAGITRPHGDRG